MSRLSVSGRYKIYLNNFSALEKKFILCDKELLRSFSKALAHKILKEFNAGLYNDHAAGLLYHSEEKIRQLLRPDDYYLELLVCNEAVSHLLPNGQLFIRRGFTPQIISLKTVGGEIFKYDEKKMMFCTELPQQFNFHQKLYNYHPHRWSLHHLSKIPEVS